MNQRFFYDAHPNQDPKSICLWHSSQAVSINLMPNARRIWITLNMPSDEQLWPNSFTGEQAPVDRVEVQ